MNAGLTDLPRPRLKKRQVLLTCTCVYATRSDLGGEVCDGKPQCVLKGGRVTYCDKVCTLAYFGRASCVCHEPGEVGTNFTSAIPNSIGR